MDKNIFLELEGKTNDLLMVNNDSSMKCTRLIKLDEDALLTGEDSEEIVDLCITSTNMNGEHEMFDKLLGKKIKISVEILD